METVLVTGGYGNLGSNITIELAERGYNVIAHGVNDRTPQIIEDLPADVRSQITRRTADLRNHEEVTSLVQKTDPDRIVHSAAILPFNSQAMRLNFDVNADGTLALLEAANESDVSRFVYVGSGSVYEGRDPEDDPYTENERLAPTHTRPYSITKYMGELACEYYRQGCGLETVTTRVSRLWGPPSGAEGEWAYPMDRLITAGLHGEDFKRPYGRDHPNDYTYHKDAAAGIVAAATVPASRLRQSVYNISSGEHITVGEIASICSNKFPEVSFDFGPGYWYELEQSIRPPFNIDAARRDLGYEPGSFESNLREYIDYRKGLND